MLYTCYMIELTLKQYNMLKEWASKSKNERCGLISCTKIENTIIPRNFILDDSLGSEASPEQITVDPHETDREIIKNEEKGCKVHILMHTHTNRKDNNTGISVSDVKFADQLDAEWTDGKKRELIMGIATEGAVSFWEKDDKAGVKQLDIKLDGEKMKQPDILGKERKSHSIEKVVNKVGRAVYGVGAALSAASIAVRTDLANFMENLTGIDTHSVSAMLPESIVNHLNTTPLWSMGAVSLTCIAAYCYYTYMEKTHDKYINAPSARYMGLKEQLKERG